MKLNGWYRIGIVLSLLWCFFIIGLTIYHYNFPSKNLHILITFEDDITKPTGPIVEVPAAPCGIGYNCEEGDPHYEKPDGSYDGIKIYYEKKPVVNYMGIFISMIVPIFVVLLLVLSIQWIIRGFKSQSTKHFSSCGSKIEIKEKIDTTKDTSPIVIDKEKTSETKDIKQTISGENDESVISSNDPTTLPVKKNKYSFGLLILLFFYGYSISQWTKGHNSTDFSIVTTIVILLTFPLIIFLYFMSRKILLKWKYFVNKIWLSSFISGFLSLILVMSIIGFSNGLEQSFQGRTKIKEINEFKKSFVEQTKEYQKQELEYSKMMMSEPKTKSEIKDKILLIDEYKKFLVKKNRNFMSLINFYRGINSKYKKNKSVDEQINKLEKINMDGFKTFIDSLDLYKKYYITGEEKYFNQVQQGFEKTQPLKDEVTQLITNIMKSL